MVWLRQDLNTSNNDTKSDSLPFEEGMSGTVDKQLKELGFSNLCARIANKFKDEMEKIAVEQREIRAKIEKLDHDMDEVIANGGLILDKSPAIIIIDDDDEEDVHMPDVSKKSSESPILPVSPTKVNIKRPSQGSQPTPENQRRRSLSSSRIITSQGCYASDSAVTTYPQSSANNTFDNEFSPEKFGTRSSVESNSETSITKQIETALSQKAEALVKGVSGEALLGRSEENEAKNERSGVASGPSTSLVPLLTQTPAGSIQVSSVAKKRLGPIASPDVIGHKNIITGTEDNASMETNMKLRSKSGSANAGNNNLATYILKNKAITLSEPILKLTPVPVASSSQSSDASSKTGSSSGSAPSTPHCPTPPLEELGLSNIFSGELSPSSMQKKVQEAKTKKTERYVIKFKEGLQVLGKPEKSDMWYPGIVEKVTPGRKGNDRYLVKFDSKKNRSVYGQLPVNHLAPVFYPDARDLNVGSRVVATRPGDTVDSRLKNRSKDLAKAKADILFGGIIAELACEENRNRYLIFFDDGFAQYLSLRKLRHVVYASQNVWEDVSVHCRDFCKEYLQEYPFRPMVKLKVGEIIETEWNGKWLNARIISLDGSLVKVLFSIDQRTEWIYRGSTRLEPLYTELDRRDQHAAIIAARAASRSRNKKKGKEEDDEPKLEPNPRIEDRITKPTFGVSKYSLKDPQGTDQWKSWKKEMSAREKEAHVAKTLGIQRLTYLSGAPNMQTPPVETSAGKTESVTYEQDTATPTAELSVENRVAESNLEHPTTSKYTASPVQNTRSEEGKNVSKSSDVKQDSAIMPAALPKSTTTVLKKPSPGSALTTSAVRASRSLRGKAPVIPYGAAAREAEAKWQAPWLKPRKRSHLDLSSISKVPEAPPNMAVTTRSRNAASLLQEKLSKAPLRKSPESPLSDNETVTTVFGRTPIIRGPHKCTEVCCPIKRLSDQERRKHNPLLIPLISGWMRETAKRRPGYRRDIYYRTPCYRRLRSLHNVTQYLMETRTSAVTIDQFCFDPAVSCREFNPKMLHPRTKIADISHGKEAVEISCVNENTNEYPPMVEYVDRTIVAEGVNINMDEEFLQCCDCTDLCQDKSKCSCCQLTITGSAAITGNKDENAGYSFRRLAECVTSGIYECNPCCSCSSSCFNRVVQNGIQARLQIFMTSGKGWGLRCLDDIPKGAFICCYAGQILTEEMANKEGKDFGDEYLAELDHIEVVEQAKEGYESDVPELREATNSENANSEKVGSGPTSEDGSSKDDFSFDDDSDSYSSCSDSTGSDVSYQPEEEGLEPPFKKKKLPEATNVDDESKDPANISMNSIHHEVIDLTCDSEDDHEKGRDSSLEPPESLSASTHESSLTNIIRRLVTCVNESKRASTEQSRNAHVAEIATGKKEESLLKSTVNENDSLGQNDNVISLETEKNLSDKDAKNLPTDDANVTPERNVSSNQTPVKSDAIGLLISHSGTMTTGESSLQESSGECSTVKVDNNGIDALSYEKPQDIACAVEYNEAKVDESEGPNNVELTKEPVSTVTSDKTKVKFCEDLKKQETLNNNQNTEIAMPSTEVKADDGNRNNDGKTPETEIQKPEEKPVSFEVPKVSVQGSGKLITKKSASKLSALLAGGKKTRALALKSTGGQGGKLFSSPRSSTGGHLTRKGSARPIVGNEKGVEEGQGIKPKVLSTRQLYGEDSCYVIDAKSFGNAGRYLNHSCSPNLFVQNVFYETHDLRFPTVAFFSLQNIPALQELTWDYSYDVDSVPGKVILCRCGTGECRGRLL